MINIALNGFGRIGKTFLRTVLLDKEAKNKLKISVINIAKADPEATALGFKYDTLMGIYPEKVEFKNNSLSIGDVTIPLISQLDPLKAPWKDYKIDWVVDASGKFTHKNDALKHITAGAKKVLITAPAVDEDCTIIPGVNDNDYTDKCQIVSLGSCTTNAFATMIKVLSDAYKIKQIFMTTVHAYTNTQALLDIDAKIKDPRRSRAAALNIVPSTTGATKTIGKVIPEVDGKITGCSLRVPVGKVSIIDMVAIIENNKKIDKSEVNKLYEQASKDKMKNILRITYDPLVSSDYLNDPYSAIVDGLLTETLGNNIKVFGWYDNEWAYSMRLKDFLLSVTK